MLWGSCGAQYTSSIATAPFFANFVEKMRFAAENNPREGEEPQGFTRVNPRVHVQKYGFIRCHTHKNYWKTYIYV